MSLKYSIREAFSGFKRARLSFTISVFTISFLLFIISIFFTLALNVNQLIDVLNAKIDIQVFLSTILDDTEIAQVGTTINSMDQVAILEFVSPDRAAKMFQQEFGEELFSILDENPLPASFNIMLKDEYRTIENIEQLANTIMKIEGVDEVEYHSEALGLLLKFSRFATIISGLLIIVVFIGSLFVVSNTIRLIVISRKDIITTMRLVGATRHFISLPYLLEGIIQGLLGGLIAFLFSLGLFAFVDSQWPGLMTTPEFLFYGLLLAGVMFGYIGSLVAIKRYL